jgi:hypothetical protein
VSLSRTFIVLARTVLLLVEFGHVGNMDQAAHPATAVSRCERAFRPEAMGAAMEVALPDLCHKGAVASEEERGSWLLGTRASGDM